MGKKNLRATFAPDVTWPGAAGMPFGCRAQDLASLSLRDSKECGLFPGQLGRSDPRGGSSRRDLSSSGFLKFCWRPTVSIGKSDSRWDVPRDLHLMSGSQRPSVLNAPKEIGESVSIISSWRKKKASLEWAKCPRH